MPDGTSLREMERSFRFLAENAKDGIAVYAADGACLYANRQTLEMLGYSAEDYYRVPIHELLEPSQVEQVLANFQARMAGGSPPHVYETCLRRRDGSPLSAELTAEATIWMGHKADVLIVRDISDRKKAEARLLREQALTEQLRREMEVRREAERELRRRDAISEAVGFAARQFLQTAHWEDCIAQVFERLAGATGVNRVHLSEIVSEPDGDSRILFRYSWSTSPPARGSDRLIDGGLSVAALGLQPCLEILRGGGSLRGAIDTYPEGYRRLLSDRGVRSILIVPVDVDGRLWGVINFSDTERERTWTDLELASLQLAGGIFGTVIGRERVERALRQSEEKYRNLVETAQQSILIISEDGIVLFANGLAQRSVHCSSAAEMLGKSLYDFFEPYHADLQASQVRSAIEAGEARVYQNPAPISGPDRWIEVRVQPLPGEQDGRRSALVIVHDITERVEAQSRILSYQEHLRLLTAELALTEQRERRKIATDLHDRLGQSLAVAKIKLGALREALPREPMAHRLEEVRGLIDHAIHEARALTSELSPPVLYELGLEPALEWLVERFRAQHGIHARFHDDGRSKPLGPDLRGLLFRSAQELLLNAAKHAHARQVSVSVRREDDSICVEVADDGVGFDASLLAANRLVVPGFGLFSIRERLRSLGGTQEVRSQPGAGTAVSLRAPLLIEVTTPEEDEE